MRLMKWMKERILRQEILYGWFLFIMLLPCLVLALTEPMSVWVRMASVLLPLAAYTLLFNLFRKPGYFLLFSFILLLINGYQLVLVYLFSESVVSPDMFLNIVTTNAGESGELMRTIWPAVLLACLLYFSATAMGIYSVCNTKKLSVRFVKKTSSLAIIPALLGTGALLINHAKGFPFQADHDIYPLNALYNLNFAVHKYIKTYNYPETSRDFSFQAHKTALAPKREVVILVVGETTRAANWQLYGYNRNTNPALSQRNNLLLFKDVLTQANTTHKIVPMILSSASAEDFNVVYSQKSITTAFKEAGFKTLFLSNQIPDRALIDAFASEADTTIRLAQVIKGEKHPLDNQGISYIKDFIDDTAEPLFIIFHTYGSHFEYSQRYAPEDAHFTPHKAGALRYKERPIFLNAYDNTICNVDRVLNDLINLLDNPDLCGSLVYLSDHGEDLMDDERKMFLHCSPVPTYYQLHIPLVAWLSDCYQKTFPQKYAAMLINQNKPVSTNAIFHTMMDLAAIESPYLDHSLSLVNSEFNISERHFIDEHDEAENFYRLGLKEKDWVMMNKMGIKL